MTAESPEKPGYEMFSSDSGCVKAFCFPFFVLGILSIPVFKLFVYLKDGFSLATSFMSGNMLFEHCSKVTKRFYFFIEEQIVGGFDSANYFERLAGDECALVLGNSKVMVTPVCIQKY